MTWEQQLMALVIGGFSVGVLVTTAVEGLVKRIVRRRRRQQLEHDVRRRLEVRGGTIARSRGGRA